jgi:DNA invertase Pin-like site-specific DNA recombinase
VLSYVRVSTDEQANGYGLDVQRERIEQFCRQERLPRSPASPAPAS